ncbi:MAG: aldo/keto reductase [Gemmatimonadales bacterium]
MTHAPDAARYNRPDFFRRCGHSGVALPRISLGHWHNFGAQDSHCNARAMVCRAFDLGITHFDLANNYGPPEGSAEESFGRILGEDLGRWRDEMIVTTKAGYAMWPGPYGERGSRKSLLASLDQSLKRLGLPYVDILYSHRPDDVAQSRGQTLAQMALAWVLRHPIVTSALIGASRVSQIEDCVGATRNLEFAAEELALIDRILA